MNEKLKVYLAGGMRTDWQDNFVQDLFLMDKFNFIDPRNKENKTFSEFVFWDLLGVEQSDIVFLYLEESNPAGHASMVEAGYALGLGKRVVFVNEQHDNKYTMFLAHCPNVIFFDNFEDGFKYFYSFGRLFK